MAVVKPGCDCGCNTPVATTPEKMLRFLANRMEYAGVADGVARLYAEDIRAILKEHYPRGFVRGDRVFATHKAGFHKGAHGVVEFVEPTGKVWVLRDGASGPVYYMPDELDHE